MSEANGDEAKKTGDDVTVISKDQAKAGSMKRKSADTGIKGKPFLRKLFPVHANTTTTSPGENSKRPPVPVRVASALAALLSRKKRSSEPKAKGQTNDIATVTFKEQAPNELSDSCKTHDVAVSFSWQERQELEVTWSLLKDDIANVGIETFMGLFNTHPDALDSFLVFKDYNIYDIEQSAILKAHTLRVMQTVDKCISRLDEPNKMATVLTSLGCRHVGYKAEKSLIPIIGKQFVAAIKPKMADRWSTETRQAWEHLFEVINYHMDKGMTSQVSKASQKDEV